MTQNTSSQQFPGVAALLEVMRRLRDPDGGCSWDQQQTLTSLIPYTLEEAYEVAAALTSGNMAAIKDELGDLLFQVVFYSQLTQEQGEFDFDQVAAQCADKLIRRHPHVFANGGEQLDPAAVKAQWEQIKQQERQHQQPNNSVFAGMADNLPSILQALKIQKRAASVGFDWHELAPVIGKIREELDELEAELPLANNSDRIEAELGDLLFAVVNLARHAQVNPEQALRRTNHTFQQRFEAIEANLTKRGLQAQQLTLEQLEHEWQAVKKSAALNGEIKLSE
ncbi:nucleoside triphosphate pyrophosphohydrolase [Pseudidiomarina mangrovi]|uniref:nucleoside triphosphate pyrophosphohydrolase n=1 Tax=Pseudidiomarina mangrovi TaxID=2487133 RepID=UPI000FCAFE82|nr:nucleoside triphosphate pyrophosphohydrolase [Pseudidiomarina mangrovi]